MFKVHSLASMKKASKTPESSSDMFTRIVKTDLKLEAVKEFQFHDVRKWRFDYAIPSAKIAIEVEGGVFKKRSFVNKQTGFIETTVGGRHTSGVGFLKDMEKYNTATSLGWRILRATPDTLLSRKTMDLIRTTIEHAILCP